MTGAAAQELEAIARIHDADPDAAARRLRALEPDALPADALGHYALLLLHVLGEEAGLWTEAAQRVQAALAGRTDAPMRALRSAAVAWQLAGAAARSDEWTARLAAAAGVDSGVAAAAVQVHALSCTAAGSDVEGFAARLLDAAHRRVDASGARVPESALDATLGAGFNNATSALLDCCDGRPASATVEAALRAGAEAARAFWMRAGTWVNHERADYLLACVLNRIGDWHGARTAARRGLDLIAAHGTEDVDRAFLLLQLAGALHHAGDADAAAATRADAEAIAASLDDAPLREWFAAERDRLFGATPTGLPR
jgi:hypothetical protein